MVDRVPDSAMQTGNDMKGMIRTLSLMCFFSMPTPQQNLYSVSENLAQPIGKGRNF
jgi:hypothetical protein